MNRNTKVINLYGGPGTGKSTNAARIFTILKDKGVEVELVTEFAKDCVWEKRLFTLENQVYVFAKQYHRIHRLLGQVEFIVTDSPILQGCVYDDSGSTELQDLVLHCHRQMETFDVCLLRTKKYQPNGRMQTEADAVNLDRKIRDKLAELGVRYHITSANREGCDWIVDIAGVND